MRRLLVIASSLCCFGNGLLLAQETMTLRDRLPVGQPPVEYESEKTINPIARLQQQLDAGETKLIADESGYLRPLLQLFDLSEASQLLVFSKTSLNVRLIAPDNPRAIYFNDEIYLAKVPGAGVLEMMTFDPLKGAMFYTLSNDLERPVKFQRESRCATCHISEMTHHIPGAMLRSIKTDKTGKPVVGFSGMSHDSAYEKRWGGWYVTGAPEGWAHSGNIYGLDQIEKHKADPSLRGIADSLTEEFDSSLHLNGNSDILPHLIFDHQIEGHNLIVRVHHEFLYKKQSDARERLVRYLLLLDEPPLPVSLEHLRNSPYAQWYQSQDSDDPTHNALHQLKLRSRLFKYACSPLIFTKQFRSLPVEVKRPVCERIVQILSGKDSETKLPAGRLGGETLELLRQVSPDFAE